MTLAESDPATAAVAMRCFHCGEPVPPGRLRTVDIDGRAEPMCCPGCEAAAGAIRAFGLTGYYRQRDALSPRPPAAVRGVAGHLAVYDDEAFQRHFVRGADGTCEARLVIAGMSCAACAWLLESRLARLPGVAACDVDFARRQARVAWAPGRIKLSQILAAAEVLGYEARPFTPQLARERVEAESSALLRRAGLAALFGMQVMMIAVALYFGEASGIDEAQRHFLRWTSLVLTLPVVAYCALPLLASARRALAAATVNMDVPVALAIVLAFGGSVWHTVAGAGAIYFDSVVMFVALLLSSRYIELRARVHAQRPLDAFAALVPDAACVVRGHGGDERFETLPAVRLAPGMHILVRAGETFAADGVVTAGEGAVDESILTGESEPRRLLPGGRVLAGSVNLESPLRVRVSAVGAQAFAGHLAALVARAAGTRPPVAELGLRIARWFVAGVLLAAAAAAVFWALNDPARVFEVTLAVLVVSCPCALALAVPAALASAYSALLANGIAVVSPGALETLAGARDFLFDKTGTLTHGTLAVEGIEAFGGHSEQRVGALAQALAGASQHPVARALRGLPGADAGPVTTAREVAGRGVAGRVGHTAVVMGSRAFVEAACGNAAPAPALPEHGAKEVWIGLDGELAGRITFSDPPRAGCGDLFAWLAQSGCRAAILSGDRAAAVERVAEACGAPDWTAALSPQEKLAHVRALQRDGATVVMTGDGLNDAPVLAHADVSIAMVDAVALSKQQADVLLLDDDPAAIRTLVEIARLTRRVIRQNFAWALAYNVLALPLAFGGMLPPWAAALGMSGSSLAVVLNALRVRRRSAANGVQRWR